MYIFSVIQLVLDMFRGCLKLGMPVIGQMGRTIRHYYKPKQKEAFYDVEGVVTKDILLFRNEDASKVFYTNLVAIMPVWGFMGYTSYSLKSKMEEFKEDVADNTKINFLLDDVLNASRGMVPAFFLCGVGLSSYNVVRTTITVRRLVLTYIAIQTYGVTWGGGKGQNVPVVHCSGIQHTFYGMHSAQVLIEGAGPQHQVPVELGGGGCQ